MALETPERDIPLLTKHAWHYVEPLGGGGQGAVYKVRSRAAQDRRATTLANIAGAIENISARNDREGAWRLKLADALATYSQNEPASAFGALKVLHLKEDSEAARQAEKRFQAEVEALQSIQHPGILRLLDADLAGHWMITELQPGLTLADSLDRFKGKPLEALRAFRPLVAAVAALHGIGVIHRDIKPANIFVGADGQLVLGDFGIVFFEDGRDRLTETFERVGTRDWMAPWANTGMRIDEVKPTFDLFPLGKVLYSMVSGQRQLLLWYFDDPRHDRYRLTTLFPDTPHLDSINEILKTCVVEHEDACTSSAKDLLALVDHTLTVLERDGDILRLETPRPCKVCGRGHYRHWPADGNQSVERVLVAASKKDAAHRMGSEAFSIRLFACDQCGHVQMFSCPDGLLPAWEGGNTAARVEPGSPGFAGLTKTIFSAIAPPPPSKHQVSEALLLALYDLGAYGQNDVPINDFTQDQAAALAIQETEIAEGLRYLEAKGWFTYTTTRPSGQLTRAGLEAAEAMRRAQPRY